MSNRKIRKERKIRDGMKGKQGQGTEKRTKEERFGRGKERTRN